ncbi:hypothetical protein CPAR01_09879 [Colletotrichum paranaense]|uniref:Uncharacterized protein n=1 Tax=Colletotrichum paranaense TaxID=1914294 RepID=A0ABQ9SCD7_9PEZI|nr:uncharacterized protein CPAR01_09879 [Colletotrichum paranaense]KAK1533171.1 hypothetical protein CPAR01_09879 [Colletotrichum paranaense]
MAQQEKTEKTRVADRLEGRWVKDRPQNKREGRDKGKVGRDTETRARAQRSWSAVGPRRASYWIPGRQRQTAAVWPGRRQVSPKSWTSIGHLNLLDWSTIPQLTVGGFPVCYGLVASRGTTWEVDR